MPRDRRRKAQVFFNGRSSGFLEETGTGYRFLYDPDYIVDGRPLSVTLPLQATAFESETLFSFFAGLSPEGWYKDIVCATKKLDPADAFGILLVTGEDTAGAVTVKEVEV